MRGRGDGDVEVALLEAEGGKLPASRLAELRDELAALRGKFPAGVEDFGFEFRDCGNSVKIFDVAQKV